jgi:hypothetical protein
MVYLHLMAVKSVPHHVSERKTLIMILFQNTSHSAYHEIKLPSGEIHSVKEIYHLNGAANKNNDRQKRIRTVFTDVHRTTMKAEYNINKYLDQQRRQRIASSLNLTERTVKIWFQNRRMEEKRKSSRTIPSSENDNDTVTFLPAHHFRQRHAYADSNVAYPSSVTYQVPQQFNSQVVNNPNSFEFSSSVEEFPSTSSSDAYPNSFQPVQATSNNFDCESFSSPSEDMARETMDIQMETADMTPENEENELGDTFSNFKIREYMNFDE